MQGSSQERDRHDGHLCWFCMVLPQIHWSSECSQVKPCWLLWVCVSLSPLKSQHQGGIRCARAFLGEMPERIKAEGSALRPQCRSETWEGIGGRKQASRKPQAKCVQWRSPSQAETPLLWSPPSGRVWAAQSHCVVPHAIAGSHSSLCSLKKQVLPRECARLLN